MDTLPWVLKNAIESACGQFRHINYTIHGDTDKARISIMFSNSDIKPVKRKSNATTRRNNKRMKEYNNSVTEEHNTQGDEENTENVVHENEINDNNTCESIDVNKTMDIDESESPFRAFRFKSTQQKDSSIDLNSPSQVNEPHIVLTDNQTVTIENKCKQIGVKRNSKVTIDPKKAVSQSERDIAKPKKTFTKIVLKESRSSSDIVIGKTLTGKLLLYTVNDKSFEVLTGKDSSYWKYNKCLEKDFDDVRNTKLMTDKIQSAIERMEKYYIDNNLDSNIF